MHSGFHTRIKNLIADFVNPQIQKIDLINGYIFNEITHYRGIQMRAFHLPRAWRPRQYLDTTVRAQRNACVSNEFRLLCLQIGNQSDSHR